MRPQRSPWTHWYKLKRWRDIRAHQLRIEPLCRMCASDGKLTVADTVDHIEKHFGDPRKFWTGALQSLCRACHEGRKKFIEARGYDRTVGPDGWPTDPQHPANTPRQIFRFYGFGIPHHLRRSAVPVTLVCGPPASGKSTYVAKHRQPSDIEINLDQCKIVVGGKPWDTDRRIFRRAVAVRNSMLRSLATRSSGRAFVVVGAPTPREREAWCQALGIEPGNVIVLDTPAETCIERLRADPARAHAVEDLIAGVLRWHHLAETNAHAA